jgi:C4-dicarboxylate-specific signal transduction histidine kinase
LLNLLLNACEAVSPESGKIDIELRRQGENLEDPHCG